MRRVQHVSSSSVNLTRTMPYQGMSTDLPLVAKRVKNPDEGEASAETMRTVGASAIDADTRRHFCRVPHGTLTADNHEARFALYQLGKTDYEIGREIGRNRTSLRKWRMRHNLPPNDPPLGNVCKEPGAKPPVKPGSRLHHTPQQRSARMLLYSLGWSDRQIAREQRVHSSTVWEWRKRLGIQPNSNPNFGRRGVTKRYYERNSLLAAIKRAIGRALPQDIADDAVADLYLAVLDGSIPIEQIEAEARKFGNRVLSQFASKFGPRSLDEELGDDDGFRMIDLVRDERSASWLEEMGATVW